MALELDSFIDALIVGTVVSSLDKMGINPMLIARQSGRLLAPRVSGAIQDYTHKNLPKTLEEHCKISLELTRIAQTADPDKSEYSCSGNILTMKLVDCAYSRMAELGKSVGYKACPLCIEALTESAFTAAVNLGETESFTVERNGDTCIIKIKLVEK